MLEVDIERRGGNKEDGRSNGQDGMIKKQGKIERGAELGANGVVISVSGHCDACVRLPERDSCLVRNCDDTGEQ